MATSVVAPRTASTSSAAGRSFFQAIPKHVNLRLLTAIAAPGVTHLHYEVVR
ncbi:hypothetical protein OG555_13330 [Kribbella sp. NBC_01484]|uniref:hypothetical protein n=1 Tax=Kribbella sp. NBC_01484 TaxID=2903579 RepID=UPI002E30403A|nr:hypothetical protein [Kribbella sp. NBC_01484]